MAYIRYFATNRDRENLARDVSQDKRLKMQRGGYNWIDAKRYMAYYLAETNDSRMPVESLVQDSADEIFKQFLGKPSIKRIIIGIHGFNVPLHGALTSFSILADTLRDLDKERSSSEERLNLIVDPTLPEERKQLDNDDNNLTAMVGFSWPSNGSVLDYSSDRIEAVSSAPALANTINAIHQANPTAKVFIVAHSMGNFLTCHMLKGLVEKQYSPYSNSEDNKDEAEKARLSYRGIGGGDMKFFVDGYFMLAPDIERRHVTKCYRKGDPTYASEQISEVPSNDQEDVYYMGPFFEGLFHLVGGVYLFYSRHDQALKASKVEKEIREKKGALKELVFGQDMDNRWEDSLGLNPAPPPAPPNMYSFNASTLGNMQVDHGNYFDTYGIVKTIAQSILSYRSPDESPDSQS